MKRNEGDSLAVREVIDQLSPQHLQNIGKSLDDLRLNELEDFVDHLAPSLTGDVIYGDPSNIHRPTDIIVNFKIDNVQQQTKRFVNAS